MALIVAFASAAWVLVDIGRHPQRMRVMAWVWPITALYAGPVAVWGYRRFGRPASPVSLREHGAEEPPPKPRWATTSVGVSHCGAGCTLGDIVAETAIFALGITIAGRALWAEFVGDYVLAVLLGLAFQYFAIAPMRGLGIRDGLIAAAKADLLSLTAFEVGLFAWMAFQALILFPGPHAIDASTPVYWFGMQIGMCLGFLTAYPVNAWLIRRGTKEAM
ncbi:DUF4396 domain-containing protein [Nocardioides sp. YIM 152315]|uniref:DUF4396 domain-containing protein n=1 Tax=Nocardioides sp. YIM 152315 TaxID=3031760 RepID=UPI0023DB361C|nr:DUF4396 domain-containing protein [Nocardioides sp. YIM 152315]MDF1605802.1 DUF4396 domain-containing protein [Nocardioides sp. YIM 152315]